MDRQTITVDISPGKNPIKRLCVTQGDKGRPLGVYITKDGSAFDLTGYSAELYVLKPDKNYYSAVVNVDSDENNLVVWATAEQETPLEGECLAQIRIRQGDLNVGTADFIEYVEKSPNQIGVESETEIETIEQYVAAAAQSAENAEEATSHYPRINSTSKHWEVWDTMNNQWADTGETASVGFAVETHELSVSTIAPASAKKASGSISKTGYYPIGIVGVSFSTKQTTIDLMSATLSGRTSGSAAVAIYVYNNDSSSSGAITAYVAVLWIKE